MSLIDSKFPAILLIVSLLLLYNDISEAQRHGYWQQEVFYEMEIDFDVDSHRFDGSQKLTYTNHSPDTLNRVFYHLYFNAFQPNSMMDQRSRTIEDPDSRVGDRIVHLEEDEIGYQKIESLTQNGRPVDFEIKGTVMEVTLAEPIMPDSETVFEMKFKAQVPLQIRRSGRDNAEGVEYSMAQWYPKMAEYDFMGWHSTPYVGREFHGVFGTFNVTIHIDRDYVVAATGYLQNPREVGHGYEEANMQVQQPEGEKLTWHFVSDYQHDFMWAADPDFVHVTARVPDGPRLRFFYQTDPVAGNAPEDRQAELLENWELLPEYTIRSFQYMNEHFGEYPFEEYMVIQGGDGGMEYIMGTLITGNRSLRSLVGVTVHELIHAWYQGVLANNESQYYWIDEGFTVYASTRIMAELFDEDAQMNFSSQYHSYERIVDAGIEEPMVTHADHSQRNVAYRGAAYTKGMIFLHQLSYIVGQKTFDRGMRRFFEEWKFKHPTGLDFIRIMERESGIQLDWYYEYWIKTTKTIDYSLQEVRDRGETTEIELSREGLMPMPLDIEVEYRDGSVEQYYIPLRIMWGQKEHELTEVPRMVADDWPWVSPAYTLSIDENKNEILRIEIDPTGRLADVNPSDNLWQPEQE
ncbi:MAG: M1 family metallopeptidase [Balneolaceae bacterium]